MKMLGAGQHPASAAYALYYSFYEALAVFYNIYN